MRSNIARPLVVAGLLALTACAAPRQDDLSLSLTELTAEIGAVDLDRAEADLAAGRYEAARQKFFRQSTMHPDDARAKLGLAEALLGLNQAEQALAIFKLFAEDPVHRARALQGQGLALLALGRTDEAGEILKQALEADADQWRAWNATGRYYDAKQQWAAAGDAYEHALALTSRAPVVLNNQGMSLLFQRRFAEAEGKFREALQTDPSLSVARNNLRLALAWQGKYAEATVGMDRAEAGDVLNNIGYVALLRGDYDTAESYLTRAMEASASFNRRAWENLRLLKSRTGEGGGEQG